MASLRQYTASIIIIVIIGLGSVISLKCYHVEEGAPETPLGEAECLSINPVCTKETIIRSGQTVELHELRSCTSNRLNKCDACVYASNVCDPTARIAEILILIHVCAVGRTTAQYNVAVLINKSCWNHHASGIMGCSRTTRASQNPHFPADIMEECFCNTYWCNAADGSAASLATLRVGFFAVILYLVF